MNPQDKIKIIEKGRESKFWELICAELEDGIRILTESLTICELREVKRIQAQIMAVKTVLNAPGMALVEQLNEQAMQRAQEENQPAERQA